MPTSIAVPTATAPGVQTTFRLQLQRGLPDTIYDTESACSRTLNNASAQLKRGKYTPVKRPFFYSTCLVVLPINW
jgi:hypothetical protein